MSDGPGVHATDSQWRSWRMNFLLNSSLSLTLSLSRKHTQVFRTNPVTDQNAFFECRPKNSYTDLMINHTPMLTPSLRRLLLHVSRQVITSIIAMYKGPVHDRDGLQDVL